MSSSSSGGCPIPVDRVPPTEFATRVLASEDHTILELSGELDIASACCLRDAVQDLWCTGDARVVINLRALQFMDTQGTHALLDLQARCDGPARSITLVPGQAPIQRVFDLTGTSPRFAWTASPPRPKPARSDA